MNGKGLDFGSLRPGRATWILQMTEDAEFTRCRGRWLNTKVMEIYIQEISSFQFLAVMFESARQKTFTLCNAFPDILHSAEQLWMANIPMDVWYIVMLRQVTR